MNNNTLRIYTLAFLCLLIFSQSGISQTRMAVYATQNIGGTYSIKQVPEKIINFFSSDESFTIIDRKNTRLINDEMRLQKSESFIDGYIVEQGKSEGVDIICLSSYDDKAKKLLITLTDVATGEIICTKEREMAYSWVRGLKNLDRELTVMMHEISTQCFDKSFPVVRMIDSSKGKAKKLLVLVGYANKIKVDYELEITEAVEEKIGDKVFVRHNVIGSGYVSKIEDENFSEVKVAKGSKEVFKALEAGKTLECKLITRK